MPQFPLARCRLLCPFIHVLRSLGAPTEALLERHKLPVSFDDRLESYLPLRNAIQFVEAGGRTLGIADFSYRAARELRFEDLSLEFRSCILGSPTLLSALEALCAMVSIEDTGLRMAIGSHGDSARLYSQIDGLQGLAYLEHSQWVQNILSIQIIREFVGRGWAPRTIAFEANYNPGAAVRKDWPETRFISRQEYSWIDIPLTLLSLPPIAGSKRADRSAAKRFSVPTTLEAMLRLMLPSYLGGKLPTVMDVAEMANVSTRGLQRTLADSGFSYRRIVNTVRFERAVDLLGIPHVKILDIALSLGYKDAAHFTRAFSKISGTSPWQFRHRLKLPAQRRPEHPEEGAG